MGLGVAGIAHRWDDDLAGEVGEVRGMNEVLDLGNLYGSSTPSLMFTSGMWGLAKAMVPVARIDRNRHFFSDVIAGSILGTVAGYAVTLQTSDGATLLSIQPLYGGTFLLIEASLRY